MKQIKKLSLSNVVGKLTRNEMRYVMAGSGALGNYKCCWIDYPNDCSTCVRGTNPTCVEGAFVKSC